MKPKTIFFISSISFVSILFFLRNLRPDCLCTDEAEQFLLASQFKLGYAIPQPPLFTWCLIGLKQICGNNVFSISLLRYLCVWIFLYYGYKAAVKLFPEPKASLAALALFSIGAINLSRYFTHLNLLAASSMFCFWAYLNLRAHKSTTNYAILGLALGLGFMSKYNFAWLFLILFLGSCLDTHARQIILNKKVWIAIAITTLIIAPHYLWLLSHQWSGFHYALGRGQAMDNAFCPNLLKNLWNIYLPILCSSLLILVSSQKLNPKPNPLIKRVLVYALICPIVFLAVLKLGYFSQRWLMGIFPIAVLCLFELIEIKQRNRLYIALSILIPTLVILEHMSGLFYPQLLNNDPKLNRPYTIIKEVLENKCQEIDIKNCRVFVYKSPQILANLQLIQTKVCFVNQAEDADLVIWNPDESHGDWSQEAEQIEALYLNSKSKKLRIKSASLARHKARSPLESEKVDQ